MFRRVVASGPIKPASRSLQYSSPRWWCSFGCRPNGGGMEAPSVNEKPNGRAHLGGPLSIDEWLAHGAQHLRRHARSQAAHAGRNGSHEWDEMPTFTKLQRKLAEESPLRVVESPTHCTVELDVPSEVRLANPTIENADPSAGTFSVRAEWTRQPVSEDRELDPITEFFRSMGLRADALPSPSMTRKIQLPPDVYQVAEARPFLEKDVLRVYVPKRRVESRPDGGMKGASDRSSVPPTPRQPTSEQQTRPAAPESVRQEVRTEGDVARAQRGGSPGSWPPSFVVRCDDPKERVFECQLPLGIDPSKLTVEFDPATNKLCLEVQNTVQIKTPVSEETQQLTYKRWVDIDFHVDNTERITTQYHDDTGLLLIRVAKPPTAAKKTATKIPIVKAR